MKTFIISTLAMVGVVACLCHEASAAEGAPQLYVGAGLQREQANLLNSNDAENNAVQAYVGAQVHENFALELGATRDNGAMEAYTLDVVATLPVAEKVDLLGSAGFVYDVSGKNDELGGALGLGAQYHLTDKVYLRGMAKFEETDFDTVGTTDVNYLASVQYRF